MDSPFQDILKGLRETNAGLTAATAGITAALDGITAANEGIKNTIEAAMHANEEREDLRETVRRLEALVRDLVDRLPPSQS